MRDFVINVILFACFLAGIGILWNSSHEFHKTHEKQCKTYIRHGGTYHHCRWVKKGGENK